MLFTPSGANGDGLLVQYKGARKEVKQVVRKAKDAAFEHVYKALYDKGGAKLLLFAFCCFLFAAPMGPTGMGF